MAKSVSYAVSPSDLKALWMILVSRDDTAYDMDFAMYYSLYSVQIRICYLDVNWLIPKIAACRARIWSLVSSERRERDFAMYYSLYSVQIRICYLDVNWLIPKIAACRARIWSLVSSERRERVTNFIFCRAGWYFTVSIIFTFRWHVYHL
jgi:hypothetical protein